MSSGAGLRVIVALAAVVVAAGAPALSRQGYTPDEEFTLFAVRGIHAHGLPLLPSGLLYDRGLLYSYVSWLAASLTGDELRAFRVVSLLSSAGVLVLGYSLIRGVASPAAGVVAAILVAASVPFWAAATTGRFYAPFLISGVAVLVLLARHGPRDGEPASVGLARMGLLVGLLAFLSRLTHELAFTLMAVPAVGLLVAWLERHPRERMRRWAAAGLAIGAGLVAAQAVLMALHFVMPAREGGGTMIQRFFLWQVLNLFERPQGTPVGVVLSALVVGALMIPARAGVILRLAIGSAVVVLAVEVALAGAVGPLVYPLDMFWHMAAGHPVMVGTALVLLVLRLCGAGGEWPAGERAPHLGWVGWGLWFGIIESGITINYLLMPTVCLLVAIGVDLVAIGQHGAALWPGRRGQLIRAALAGVALVVVADQWRGTGSLPDRLAAARPTINIEGIGTIRDALRPTDVVACTDELACLLLVGRVDAWLALDDYVRERFVVMRGSTGVGVYAGSRAAFSPADLLAPRPDGRPPARLIAVDVFKDYPVGNSRTWLPRAIEAAGLESRTLLLTGQARVEEIGDRR